MLGRRVREFLERIICIDVAGRRARTREPIRVGASTAILPPFTFQTRQSVFIGGVYFEIDIQQVIDVRPVDEQSLAYVERLRVTQHAHVREIQTSPIYSDDFVFRFAKRVVESVRKVRKGKPTLCGFTLWTRLLANCADATGYVRIPLAVIRFRVARGLVVPPVFALQLTPDVSRVLDAFDV